MQPKMLLTDECTRTNKVVTNFNKCRAAKLIVSEKNIIQLYFLFLECRDHDASKKLLKSCKDISFRNLHCHEVHLLEQQLTKTKLGRLKQTYITVNLSFLFCFNFLKLPSALLKWKVGAWGI